MKKIVLFLLLSAKLFCHFEYDPLVFYKEQVNTFTGDYQIRRTDHVVDAVQPIPILRTYDASVGTWHLLPQTDLVVIGEKGKANTLELVRIEAFEPNGSLFTYTLKDGEYCIDLPKGYANTSSDAPSEREHPKHQSIEWIDEDTLIIHTPKYTKRIYHKWKEEGQNLYFHLASEELANGNFFLYTYDSEARLLSIQSTNPSQTKTWGQCTFFYSAPDQDGYELTIETSDGNKLYYHFTLLERSKVRGNLYGLSIAPEETFEYKKLSRTLGFRISKHNSTSLTYDRLGRVATLGATTFDYQPQLTLVTEGNGQVSSYHFNRDHLLTKLQTPYRTLEKEWGEGGLLLKDHFGSTVYDSRGNPTLSEGKARTYDEEGRLATIEGELDTRFTYLGHTDLLQEIALVDGSKVWIRTRLEYDEDHLLVSKTVEDGLGHCSYTLELEGPPERPEAILEKSHGNLLSRRPLTYEGNQLLEPIPYSLSVSLLTTLDPREKFLRYQDPTFKKGAQITRDKMGRVIKQEVFDEAGNLLYDEHWSYTPFHLIQHTDPEGLVTRFEYNLRGDKVREIVDLKESKRTTHFTYDLLGRLETKTEGELVTRYLYDEEGNPPLLQEEDLAGNVLTTNAPASPSPRELTLPSFYEILGAHTRHDALGRLTEVYTTDGSVHYALRYNPRGDVIELIDKVTGKKATRTYDRLGNLIEETLLNGETVANSYDAWGRKLLCELPDGSEITYHWGPKFLKEICRETDQERFTYQHAFLEHNQLGFPTKQKMIEAFGECNFQTNAMGKLISIHSAYFFESKGQKHRAVPPSRKKEYDYKCDGLGRIVEFQTADQKIQYTYDIWNRRLSKKVFQMQDSSWVKIQHLHYLYDNALEIGAMDLDEYWLRSLRICAPYRVNTGDNAVAYELDGMPYAPIHDLEGNVRVLLSVIRGKVMESYSFSPTGSEEIRDNWDDVLSSSKANNPWRFRCAHTDEETGLIYTGDGYYEPATGQSVPSFRDATWTR